MRCLSLLLAFSLALPACLQVPKSECREELRATTERLLVVEEEKKVLEAKVAKLETKVAQQLAQLDAVSDEALRIKLQKQLDVARAEAERVKRAPPSKACNCNPNDPLCSCL